MHACTHECMWYVGCFLFNKFGLSTCLLNVHESCLSRDKEHPRLWLSFLQSKSWKYILILNLQGNAFLHTEQS